MPIRPPVFRLSTLMLLMIPVALACWLAWGVRQARRATTAGVCTCHLSCNLRMGLLNYRETYGRYPKAATLGPDGRPSQGWRALAYAANGFYGTTPYDLTKPWGDPGNRRSATLLAKEFACPNTQDSPHFTNYVAVIDGGVSTFDKAAEIPRESHKLSEQVLVIEYPNSDIEWDEPRSLDVADLPKLGEPTDPGGLSVLFADGTLRRMPRAEVLRLFGR